MRRHLLTMALAATVVVSAAACQDAAGGGEERLPAPGQSAGSPAPAGDVESVSPAEQPAPAGGVLASRDVHDSGADLRIEVTGLRRQGQALTLTWRLTVISVDDRWYLGSTFGTGALDFTASAVTLVDPVNAKRYLVARSGGEDGECACSQRINIWMSEGDTTEIYATYSAPPPDVAAINVEFPRFGAFTDVPIS